MHHRRLGQHIAALVIDLIDQEAAAYQGRAALLDQLNQCGRHLAGRQHIVHQKHTVTRTYELAQQVQRHGIFVLPAGWSGHRVHDSALGGRRGLRDGHHERQLHGQRALACDHGATPRRDDLRRLHARMVLTKAVGEVLAAVAHELAVHLVVDEGVQPEGLSIRKSAGCLDAALQNSRRGFSIYEEPRVPVAQTVRVLAAHIWGWRRREVH
mmetsp:Transcript_287/g.632  ORF Transcript_287/g.632 Transcript_287/m.632 type:complete len:211 (-) Transcript_287:30-662(-)